MNPFHAPIVRVIIFILVLSTPVLGREYISVGYADVDITPPLGGSMPGYLTDRISTGILDPLLAKSLVLTKGKETLVIIALDLIGLEAPEVKQIRDVIRKRTGIGADHIFIHATHTHTGAMVPRRFTSDAGAIYPGLYPGNVDQEWISQLPDRIGGAVEKALSRRVEESAITLGAGREETIAFYRRFVMKNGAVRTNPGRGNPDIVRPAGEIDPAVYVLSFENARTMLVSYGLHPDCVGGTRYSADYPYHLTETIRNGLGKDWNILYLNATCGNINHIDVHNPAQRSSYEESRRIGQMLARSVLAARQKAQPLTVDRLAARAKTVASPLRRISHDVAEQAAREVQTASGAPNRNFNEFFAPGAYVLSKTTDRFHPAEVIVFRIGSLGLVGLPAEVFVEVAREIKAGSPLQPVLVIGVTGGYMGYLPHPRGYDEGGYEAGYRSARYDPSTPVLWVKTARELVRALSHWSLRKY